jgi:hypothetical protein
MSISRYFIVVGLLFFVSCAGLIKNVSIEPAYRDKILLDKKLLVLPFDRKSISFDQQKDSSAFDSLDQTVHGMLVPVLNSLFSGSVSVRTNNALPLVVVDPAQSMKLMNLIIDHGAQKQIVAQKKIYDENNNYKIRNDTTSIIDPNLIKSIVPDAQIILQITKISHATRSGVRRIFADFVFYDADSGTLVTKGTEKLKLSFREAISSNRPGGETWFKWFTTLALQVIDKSPFASDYDRRISLSYYYKPKGFPTVKKYVVSNGFRYRERSNTYPGVIEKKETRKITLKTDSLVAKTDILLRQMINDTVSRLFKDSINSAAEKKSGNAIPLSVQMLKKCSPMNGMVVLAADNTSTDGLRFKKFFSTIANPDVVNMVYSSFNANDSLQSLSELNRSSTHFIVPILVKISPDDWNSAVTGYLDSLYSTTFAMLKNREFADISQEIGKKNERQQDAAASAAMMTQMGNEMNRQMLQQQMQLQQQQQVMMQMQQAQQQMQQMQQINQMQMQRMQQINIPKY